MAKNDSAKKGLKDSDKDSNKSVQTNSKSSLASSSANSLKTTDKAIKDDNANSPESTSKSMNTNDGSAQKAGLGSFFKDVQIELSKVAWPSRQQLISESIAVLLMVIVAAILVYFVDSLFSWAASKVFQ